MDSFANPVVISVVPNKPRLVQRRGFKVALLSLLLFEAVMMYSHFPAVNVLASQNVNYKLHALATAKPATAARSDTAKPSAGTTTSPTVSASVTPTAIVPAISVVPSCTRQSVNPIPSTLTVSASQPGVQQVIDAPQYYQVYGNTASQVQNQISSCTPVSENGDSFAASTNYAIDWNYTYTITGSTCSIGTVAVGVHISQIYPNWNNYGSAVAGYVSRWQSFMANLQTHENGHRDLDVQYADKVLSDLQSLGPSDCSGFMANATAVANADIAALNNANDAYDAQTDHGRTQGAVIPSN